MIQRFPLFLFLLLSVVICCNRLSAQDFPYSITLNAPFSPGGFNTIGNASVTGYGSILWGDGNPMTFEIDGGAAGQKMDVFTMNYPAPLGSPFSVVFSFINTSQGIPM
jgi:hypothetical protein